MSVSESKKMSFDELLGAPKPGLSEPMLAHEMALYVKHELTTVEPIVRDARIDCSHLVQFEEAASPA